MTQTTDTPLVSVIIPAYNSAWCISTALDSVLAQSYKNLEIIVVNDGSTDETGHKLASYGDSIQVINQENGGMSNARNAGIKAANGDYIAFLDADDWWMSEKLERQIELMQKQPELGFCSTAARVQNPEGELITVWYCRHFGDSMLKTLFSHNAAVAGGCSAVLVRRNLLDQTGLFDEKLKGFEDPDLWIRLAAISDYSCINTPLAVILRRKNSVSDNLEAMRNSALQSIIKNRRLLSKELQGAFWRYCLSGVYTDYAKGSYRSGNLTSAISDTFMAFVLSPMGRGRLCLSLLKDMVLGRKL